MFWCVQWFFHEETGILALEVILQREFVDDDLFCNFTTGEDGVESKGRDAVLDGDKLSKITLP